VSKRAKVRAAKCPGCGIRVADRFFDGQTKCNYSGERYEFRNGRWCRPIATKRKRRND